MVESSEEYLAFKAWVGSEIQNNEIHLDQELQLSVLHGDAGFRKYFRLNTKEPLLAVYAPPATEDNRGFDRIARFLYEGGIRAPKILATDFSHGFFLLQDLGPDLLLKYLQDETVDTLYSHALMLLLRLQQCTLDYSVFPAYETEKLREEMMLFPEWFVEKHLGLELNEGEQQMLDDLFSELEKNAAEQPKVVVHRDYHSRNLIYEETGNFGVVDFQDAVIGPVSYDLVSILKDCYVSWEPERVERWALAYANMAAEIGIMPPVSREKFIRWFDWMGLQRHLKVLGIFCRLSLRDGKDDYLNDLPLVVQYTRDTLAKYKELTVFSEWFEATLMPIINQKKSWMKVRPGMPGI